MSARRDPAPGQTPSTTGPREGEGGVEGLLRGWLESMQEDAAEPETPPIAAPPASPSPTPGFVPPGGPLPMRFGPSRLTYWGSRLAAVAGFGFAYVFKVGGLLEKGAVPLFLIAAVAIAAWAVVGRLKRGEIEAVSVTFEPAGISVKAQLGSHHLSWGDLVGLRPPPSGARGWAIEANVSGRTIMVRLPRDKEWAKRMIEALRGGAGRADPRFERPARDSWAVPPAAAPQPER